MDQDKKHIGKFVQISMDLYAPRWNVLKLNIAHNQELLSRQQSLKEPHRNNDLISMYKREIFHKLEELQNYNHLFN